MHGYVKVKSCFTVVLKARVPLVQRAVALVRALPQADSDWMCTETGLVSIGHTRLAWLRTFGKILGTLY